MKQKTLTKSDKIRKFLDRGLSRPQICKKLNVSQQLVYIVARNHGALNDTQSSIAKKLGISGKKYASKRAGGTSKDQKFISKLLALVDAYRKGK